MLEKFQDSLIEGATLLIKNPTFGANNSNFKTVDYPHKICFCSDTKVYPCNNFTGSAFGFDFTPLSAILDNLYVKTQPIDVIGEVLCCTPMEKVTVKGGKKVDKRSMLLEDLNGTKVAVTLWESYAHQLTDYIDNNPTETRVFMIVQCGRVSWFKEKPTVNNSFKLTRLFINTGCDEITSFKKSKMERSETNGSQRSTSSLHYSLRDDFLLNHEFIRVSNIYHVKEKKCVIIIGTIKSVVKEIPWFYEACSKCTHKVILKKPVVDMQIGEEKVWICQNEKCDKKDISAVQRFRIPLRVQDDTGLISLTLFEKDATQIFKKSAKEMWEKYLQGGYKGLLPDDFELLLEKKYAFKVDVDTNNINGKYEFFGISQLFNDLGVISELEETIKDNKAVESNSLNRRAFEEETEDTTTSTDSVSFKGENETPPIAQRKSRGKQPIAYEVDPTNTARRSELKRNLHDVYDVDDDVACSATKARVVNVATPAQDGKSILLTPKLEKN